jgi:hypothetical protein
LILGGQNLDLFDPGGELDDAGTLDPLGPGQIRPHPDQGTASRQGQSHPTEGAAGPAAKRGKAEQAGATGQEEQSRPLARIGQSEPQGNACTKGGNGPERELSALRLEEGFDAIAGAGDPQSHRPASALWQRRILYVRGAHPIHSVREHKGKRA